MAFEKVKGIISSCNKRGIKRTIAIIYYELVFNIKFTKSTSGLIELTDLDVACNKQHNSSRYQPVSYYLLRKIFGNLNIDKSRATLLDYGCGKGRVLLYSLLSGFNKVIGVEFSELLCNKCLSLLRSYNYQEQKVENVNYEVVCMDAGKYKVPEDVNIIFLYNPFGADTIKRVLLNVNDSLESSPRNIVIIYVEPIHSRVFDESGWICTCKYNNDVFFYSK